MLWADRNDTPVSYSYESRNVSINNASSSETFHYDLDYMSKMYEDTIRREVYNRILSYNTPFPICLMALYAVTFIFGLLGNVLVISVVLRHENMRTVTNVFLVNLAVGDLLVVVLCMPFSLAPYIYRNWIYGGVICKLTPFVQGTSVGVSVLSLLFISLDRFLAIHKPMQARSICSKVKVRIIVVAIWLVAMAICLPMAVVSDVTSQSVGDVIELHMCEEHWESLRSKNLYNLSMFVLLYCVPLACMLVTYCKISKTLWHGDQNLYDESVQRFEHARRIIAGRRRVVRMLILLVVIFALLWLPYHVINIYLDFNRKVSTSGAIALYGYPIAQWLALANSSTNPVCYCFMSKTFRDAFTNMFLCGACQKMCATSPRRLDTDNTVISKGSARERRRLLRTFNRGSPATSGLSTTVEIRLEQVAPSVQPAVKRQCPRLGSRVVQNGNHYLYVPRNDSASCDSESQV